MDEKWIIIMFFLSFGGDLDDGTDLAGRAVSPSSSLESMDEPELRYITSDSRPGTSLSRKSAPHSTKNDPVTQGIPDHPIEIPRSIYPITQGIPDHLVEILHVCIKAHLTSLSHAIVELELGIGVGD